MISMENRHAGRLTARLDRIAKLVSSSRRATAPALPDGIRIYAIGDIHGRADLVEEQFARIDEHLRRHLIAHPLHVFLGDYIDRGNDSRRVIDLLIERGRLHHVVFLKGNHETFLCRFLDDPRSFEYWRRLGGAETLRSYGLHPQATANDKVLKQLSEALSQRLPSSHKAFLSGLQTSFSCGGFFFAHAGVKPGVPLDQQTEEDLLWIREEFLFHEGEFGKVVVHGHTPVQEPEIRRNRINIDTGAYASGRLTCLLLEAEAVAVLE
jgi:diadenosine tetraphosphatase ApaH/serine/threonine PP2A family protein phosphatase